LQTKIASVYQIDKNSFSLMFDGDSIDCSSDTPEDLDIENDFLIDIKVC
jgi:hypothetical protein